jgi:proteasome alpha subunit
VGDTPESDQLYRLTFDGSVVDEPDFVVMGGQAEAVSANLREHFLPGMGLAEALRVGVQALSAVSPATSAGNGGPALLSAEQLEVAVLDRRRPKRAFRRIVGAALRPLLEQQEGDGAAVGGEEPHTAAHAPSVPQPGTPPGLGEPSAPDSGGTAGSGGEAPTT